MSEEDENDKYNWWLLYYRSLKDKKEFVDTVNAFYQLTALLGSLFLTVTVPAIDNVMPNYVKY
jgi:hypothetical protein